jgi:hypothetical protein
MIDATNENTMETMTIPYLKLHSVSLPSEDIDPSNKSLPTDKKNNILTTKNNTRPNVSIRLKFISENDTMNTNIKKKYFINDFDSIVAILAIPTALFIY